MLIYLSKFVIKNEFSFHEWILKKKISTLFPIYIVNETTLKHKSPKTFPIQLYNTASCTTRNEFTLNNQRTRFVDWNRVGGTESINVFTGKITRIFVSFSQRRQRERCNKKKKNKMSKKKKRDDSLEKDACNVNRDREI